jgi:hypothetical protein
MAADIKQRDGADDEAAADDAAGEGYREDRTR